MEKERPAHVACECLHLPCPEPDLTDWISMVEALKHGGISNHVTVNIQWADSETVTADNAEEILHGADGILVPGGFGDRGIDGKIHAISYARAQHPIPLSRHAAIRPFPRQAHRRNM